MAESPTRKQSLSLRFAQSTRNHKISGQNRFQTTHNKYESISQKSPVVGSPRLNEQSHGEMYETRKHQQLNMQLKTKLQIVLKHNSQLLNQNATLSQMINTMRIELEILKKQNATRSLDVNVEMGKLIEEVKNQQILHEGQLNKLLNQISHLHQQNLLFQKHKTAQIKSLKQTHQRQLSIHITQIKRSSDDSKDILELQIKKLRQTIQLRDFEIQSLKTQAKCEGDRLKSENNSFKTQIEHIRKLKEIQMKEIIIENRQKLKSQFKQFQRQKQIDQIKQEVNVKKLKKQINQKNLQIEQTRKQGATQTEQLYDQLTSLQKDKAQLLQQLQDIKESSLQKLNRQKERLRLMSTVEKQNMDSILTTERTMLKEERQKIILLCIQKTHEIKRLYEIINEQKDTFEQEASRLSHLVQELKAKLREIELGNKQEIQLLKIKIAQLHEGDIKALEGYYENEVRNLIKQNRIISELHQADRAKLHKSLQQNDQLRKNFEIQTSKQKAKLQDMKVKFAAANVEFRQQITSLGTKMQLTSQTLLRQTEQKQKGAQFFQTEKRKFYRIIEQKDREIIAVHETMSRLKQINDQQIAQLHSQINMLRDELLSRQQQFKQFKSGLQTEFQRKSMKLIEEARNVDPDQKIIQENETLREKCDRLEKQCFKKTKQVEFLLRQTKSLQAQLGLRAGFIQTLQLQSSAAIEDEKSKIKVLMNQSEVAMKDYYENKLQSRQKDIQNLKKQLGQKDYDLRGIISKYNGLQRKMKQLLEAQSKLTQFEQKIVSLGMDQNLVKNMAELFKKYKNE